jgi:hypothetical protein
VGRFERLDLPTKIVKMMDQIIATAESDQQTFIIAISKER